ncbi:MAG: hypothetical protein KF862_07325 [Chitinophagaceae bacterium]|nr:hypothetical protein [Chitinophagaceae bacterium]
MKQLLEKFENLGELLNIIQFQTGVSLEKVAVAIGYEGAYVRAEKKKDDNKNLVDALKRVYGEEIEQFVRKYGKIYIEVAGKDIVSGSSNSGLPGQDPLSFLQKIEEKQKALAGEIGVFLKSYSPPLSESDSALTRLESDVRKFHDNAGEKGKENKGRANRGKKP